MLLIIRENPVLIKTYPRGGCLNDAWIETLPETDATWYGKIPYQCECARHIPVGDTYENASDVFMGYPVVEGDCLDMFNFF